MSNTPIGQYTDAELKTALRKAASQEFVSINVDTGGDLVMNYEIEDLRRILEALPEPRELPTEHGSIIRNVTDEFDRTYRVMTLDNEHDWCGVNADTHEFEYVKAHQIVSWEPFEDKE